ncbi:MAG: DUF3164 family protein [Plesiomonas sp.]|uniref:DUF3164 family protein n=1 Tax=Plesiomonas sp. TaxID=2486279 RepID=UPI003F38388F
MNNENKQQQYTQADVLAGYWVDGRGVLTPEMHVKPVDKDRDALVGEIVEKAIALNAALAAFKGSVFGDIQAHIDLAAEKYGVMKGGKKGNVTLYTFDGRYKVQRAIQERIAFDERLQVAKSLVDECLMDWTEDSRPEIRALIDEAFQVDKEGEVSTARILRLLRLDIDDKRWQNAMEAIKDAIKVVGSKQYIRIFERVGDSDQYRPISLDLAAV